MAPEAWWWFQPRGFGEWRGHVWCLTIWIRNFSWFLSVPKDPVTGLQFRAVSRLRLWNPHGDFPAICHVLGGPAEVLNTGHRRPCADGSDFWGVRGKSMEQHMGSPDIRMTM